MFEDYITINERFTFEKSKIDGMFTRVYENFKDQAKDRMALTLIVNGKEYEVDSKYCSGKKDSLGRRLRSSEEQRKEYHREWFETLRGRKNKKKMI